MVGSTWSPANSSPASRSANTKCPWVWPGVATASSVRLPTASEWSSRSQASGSSHSDRSTCWASASSCQPARHLLGAGPPQLPHRGVVAGNAFAHHLEGRPLADAQADVRADSRRTVTAWV